MFDSIATSWPDNLRCPSGSPSAYWSLEDLAKSVRLGIDECATESALLSYVVLNPGKKKECWALLCWLHFNTFNRTSFFTLLEHLRSDFPDSFEARVLTLVGWLWTDDYAALATAPSGIWEGISKSRLLKLCRVASYLKLGDFSNASRELQSHRLSETLEGLMLQASLLSKLGRADQAMQLLKPIVPRVNNHLRFYKQLLQHMLDGLDSEHVLEMLREILRRFGEHHEILFHVTTVNLCRRQPGLARRSSLIQTAWGSVRVTPINVGNQLNTYEGNGQCDWLEYLTDKITSSDPKIDAQTHSNLVMQLGSLCTPSYSRYLKGLVNKLMEMPEYRSFTIAGKGVPRSRNTIIDKRLRIGWVTGDFAYHPVARFLYGIFAGSTDSTNFHHHLVSVIDHNPNPLKEYFNGLSNINVFDASKYINEERVAAIRDLQCDVMVDLSGWTGGNYIAGFLARLAPVQVNYLGYFASSGLPMMDYWLGDDVLFPREHSEWSSESLWRLSRPFIAWRPVDPLPEAHASVLDAKPGPVRFGSFNHNRKLSDKTLRLWGTLLGSVPESRLVLKAACIDDLDTQRLLRRRMVRQGLDPERIDWLPLTEKESDHLAQYANIDIALDPTPNGGCTTTCEALWLGVPTITMAGNHYVSRMGAAVMAGVGLNEWIASDACEYIQLAQEHASRLQELRQKRSYWRKKLENSLLGDPADLMQNLESSFLAMHNKIISRV